MTWNSDCCFCWTGASVGGRVDAMASARVPGGEREGERERGALGRRTGAASGGEEEREL